MFKRGMVGLFAVVVVIMGFRAVSLAQRSAKPMLLAIQSSDPAREETRRWKSLGGAQDKVGIDPSQVPPPGTALEKVRVEAIAGDDPMGAVETFLDRNRKEADEAIQGLTREAEILRARLQKVEAALTRWQAVSGALNQKEFSNASPPDPELTAVETPPGPPKGDGNGPPDALVLPPPSTDSVTPPPIEIPEPKTPPVMPRSKPSSPPLEPNAPPLPPSDPQILPPPR